MPDFNTFRVNDHRVKLLMELKLKGYVEPEEERIRKQSNLRLQSSTSRPMDFGTNLIKWFVYIHNEHKRMVTNERNEIIHNKMVTNSMNGDYNDYIMKKMMIKN